MNSAFLRVFNNTTRSFSLRFGVSQKTAKQNIGIDRNQGVSPRFRFIAP